MFYPTPEELELVADVLTHANCQDTRVLSREAATDIFPRSKLSLVDLKMIWDISDNEPYGTLNTKELAMALRLMGWVQAGEELHKRLLSQPGPLPTLDGISDVRRPRGSLVGHLVEPIITGVTQHRRQNTSPETAGPPPYELITPFNWLSEYRDSPSSPTSSHSSSVFRTYEKQRQPVERSPPRHQDPPLASSNVSLETTPTEASFIPMQMRPVTLPDISFLTSLNSENKSPRKRNRGETLGEASTLPPVYREKPRIIVQSSTNPTQSPIRPLPMPVSPSSSTTPQTPALNIDCSSPLPFTPDAPTFVTTAYEYPPLSPLSPTSLDTNVSLPTPDSSPLPLIPDTPTRIVALATPEADHHSTALVPAVEDTDVLKTQLSEAQSEIEQLRSQISDMEGAVSNILNDFKPKINFEADDGVITVLTRRLKELQEIEKKHAESSRLVEKAAIALDRFKRQKADQKELLQKIIDKHAETIAQQKEQIAVVEANRAAAEILAAKAVTVLAENRVLKDKLEGRDGSISEEKESLRKRVRELEKELEELQFCDADDSHRLHAEAKCEENEELRRRIAFMEVERKEAESKTASEIAELRRQLLEAKRDNARLALAEALDNASDTASDRPYWIEDEEDSSEEGFNA
ncbi:hypothetical protein FA15DRAFT_674420 [Coprinopsis marcescibilis]|uniref:EH domain-containing protein n=1 Tax=Coprinopsis marcescibilis TaxID=230819 RepID=A0A5C3KHQ2_COPMA|nr:hypothetical protein FA15DRAFT_674420 [Coprinopsis marcescibilis]